MEKGNKKRPNIIKRYQNIISNGLLLFGIRNKLAKIGLDIDPYYWVQEEVKIILFFGLPHVTCSLIFGD